MSNVNETRKYLRRVAAIIRSGWTQGPIAVDRSGSGTDATDPAACKWCLAGAMRLARRDLHDWGPYYDAERAIKVVCRMTPISYNETRGRTKQQVLAKIREAIERLPRMRHMRSTV